MEGYVSAKQLAKTVMICLGLTALLDLISVGLAFSQLSLLGRAAVGAVSMEEAQASDKLVALASGALVLLLLVNAYFFLSWMKRAHRNLDAFGVSSGYSDSYVRWAFFIPFANLVRPYRVMKAIWDGSVPADQKLIGKSSQILTMWWAAWIISGFFGRAGNGFDKEGSSISALETATNIGIIGTLINMAAAVLAILSVRAITERQESCASGQVAHEFD